MNKLFYIRGIGIIVATLAASAILCFGLTQRFPQTRAGYQLDGVTEPLGSFEFTERSSKLVTDQDLVDNVWIAGFVFTRCRSSCPVICARIAELQEKLRDRDIQFVCISVDPEYDTTEILSEYAERFEADPDRWWFLRGDRKATYELIQRGFLQSTAVATEEDLAAGSEEILHSTKIALVDRGNQVIGVFDVNDAEGIERLIERSRQLGAPDHVRSLPLVNASLNGFCAVLLVLGWVLIRFRAWKLHAFVQVAALTTSAVFLSCYLYYHAEVGSVKFQGVGISRPTYFTILLSHTTLAVVMVPMILLAVYRAVRKRWDQHKRISSLTFPIWLYVSLTGVVIYLMLYQLDFSLATSGPLAPISLD